MRTALEPSETPKGTDMTSTTYTDTRAELLARLIRAHQSAVSPMQSARLARMIAAIA